MNKRISFYSNGYDSTSTVTEDISNLSTLISISHENIINIIKKIRSTSDKGERKKLKLSLPMFTAAGVFNSRHNDDLKTYSNYICLDFDGIDDPHRYQVLFASFKAVPSVYMEFKSPSGGIKVIVCHNNNNPNYHQNLFCQLKSLPQFNIPEFDEACKNLSRTTFISWDPDMYVNKDVIPFDYHYDPKYDIGTPAVQQKTVVSKRSTYSPNTNLSALVNDFPDGVSDNTIINWMDKHQWRLHPEDYQEGHRHNSLMKKAARMASWGVGYDAALKTLLYKYTYFGLPEEGIEKDVDYCYETCDFGCNRQEFFRLRDALQEDPLSQCFDKWLKK